MINFLSNNIMLPILDFFYGIVPSYGLAIVALTLVIRFALFPVSANQIRNMRRMKIANPIMQKRTKEVQERYKNDPLKQREEIQRVQSENFKEFGNPLSGCLPALLQLPILFALFATLRGSPFANINYTVNFQVYPQAQQEQVQPQAFATKPQSVYFADRVHIPIQATVASGTNLLVGDTVNVDLRSPEGQEFNDLSSQYPETNLAKTWQITKGEGVVQVDDNGNIVALQPGEATVQVTVPGLAANKGFLFIQALGKVGVTNADGSINYDILAMIMGFGLSLYINQAFTNQSSPKPDSSGEEESGSQQEFINKFTPVIFSGMFLFFPLPSGVLLYMLIANVFQTLQSFLISREPLPENLQRILDGGPAMATAGATSKSTAPAPTKSAKPKSEKSATKAKGRKNSKVAAPPKMLKAPSIDELTDLAESSEDVAITSDATPEPTEVIEIKDTPADSRNQEQKEQTETIDSIDSKEAADPEPAPEAEASPAEKAAKPESPEPVNPEQATQAHESTKATKPSKPTKPAKASKSKKQKQTPVDREPLPFEPGYGKKKKSKSN
jgi:YidC/Oxa1 family membrane protein insertase